MKKLHLENQSLHKDIGEKTIELGKLKRDITDYQAKESTSRKLSEMYEASHSNPRLREEMQLLNEKLNNFNYEDLDERSDVLS